jgi:hypothetical protein
MHDCVGIGPVAVRQLDVVEPDAPGAVVLLQAVGLGCELGDGLVTLSFSAICFWRARFWALESLSSFSKAATLAGSVSRAVSLAKMSSSCVLVSGISAMAAADLLLLPEGAIV